MKDPIVIVGRQPRAWKKAGYRLSAISDLTWSCVSGGVNVPLGRDYLHGFVRCDQLESGDLDHSCLHRPGPPHRIKVVMTKKDNRSIWATLLQLCPEPARPPTSEVEKASRRARKAFKAAGLSKRVGNILVRARLAGPEQALSLDEDALARLPGVGPVALAELRVWRSSQPSAAPPRG